MRPISIDDYIPYLVNRVAVRLIKNATPHFRGHGLSVPQWRVLLALWERERMTFGELASITSVEPPTLSRLLDLMQNDGLCRRRRNKSDSRVVYLSLTAAGRQLFEETIPWANDVERNLLKGLSKAQVAGLRAMLVTMFENVENWSDGNGRSRSRTASNEKARIDGPGVTNRPKPRHGSR